MSAEPAATQLDRRRRDGVAVFIYVDDAAAMAVPELGPGCPAHRRRLMGASDASLGIISRLARCRDGGLVAPARPGRRAAQGMPSPFVQEVLVKSILVTLSDAVAADNFTVLHAKISKPFRDQFPPEKLREVFKDLVDKHAVFDAVVAKPIVPDDEAKIDEQRRAAAERPFRNHAEAGEIPARLHSRRTASGSCPRSPSTLNDRLTEEDKMRKLLIVLVWPSPPAPQRRQRPCPPPTRRP